MTNLKLRWAHVTQRDIDNLIHNAKFSITKQHTHTHSHPTQERAHDTHTTRTHAHAHTSKREREREREGERATLGNKSTINGSRPGAKD